MSNNSLDNKKDSPRVLYISTVDPLVGPGTISLTQYSAMKKFGLDVTMLTHYPVEGHPDILFVEKKNCWNQFRFILRGKLLHMLGYRGGSFHFFYRKENHPPVRVSKVLKCIRGEYDLVIVYFWQKMLSFKTINAIYEKLSRPTFFFIPPDFSIMSGGCHFPGECSRYQIGCGMCPAFESGKDKTAWNVSYRKHVYEKINPVIWCNTYMKNIFQQSFLLKNSNLVLGMQAVNTELFRPLDKQISKQKYGFNSDDCFVISFGCQGLTNPRKGIKYLIEALNIWYSSLTEQDKSSVHLLIAGKDYENIADSLPFPSKGIGFIKIEQLPLFYSASDIFVCPSINDPGPSMVLQSIACGTPVVGFEMGAILDYVKGKETGYCAKLKDSKDLANGIDCYFRMTKTQKQNISLNCRKMVMDHFTYQAAIRRMIDVYWHTSHNDS